VLYVLSGTARGQVFISATVYQPGYTNSNEALRQDLSNALNDFSLTGTYIGEPPTAQSSENTSEPFARGRS
jgi:diacylglycerol O-acyltransferase